jgi:hypothetical protein
MKNVVMIGMMKTSRLVRENFPAFMSDRLALKRAVRENFPIGIVSKTISSTALPQRVDTPGSESRWSQQQQQKSSAN